MRLGNPNGGIWFCSLDVLCSNSFCFIDEDRAFEHLHHALVAAVALGYRAHEVFSMVLTFTLAIDLVWGSSQ